MKKFMENPVSFLTAAIVALVLLASYLDTIVAIASLAAMLIALVFLGRWMLARGHQGHGGTYCGNCGHIGHGRQVCQHCRCRAS